MVLDPRFSETTKIVATKNQVSGDLAEAETVILNLKDGMYYGVSEVGWRVWNIIQEPRTLKEVRDILLDEYNIDENRCMHDLTILISDLLEHGLVEITNPTSG